MRRIGGLGIELKDISREMCVEALCQGDVQAKGKEAIRQTGRQAQRKSKLDPQFLLWFLVSMSLQRFVSIPNVLVGLMVGLRGRFRHLPLHPASDGAIAHARRRLGMAPLAKWFQLLSESIEAKPLFHGLCVWIVDGTTLSLPDTAKNEAVFGKRKASRGKTAFPRLKLTGLLEGYSRRLKKVRIFPDRHSELRGFRTLVEGLGKGDLLLGDRHFHSFTFAADLTRRKVDFLFRTQRNLKIRIEEVLGAGDFIGTLTYRCRHEDLPSLPNVKVVSTGTRKAKVQLQVRVLEYRLANGEWSRLITSLVDPGKYESMELVLLYHRRWDIELAYDEVKTHLSQPGGGMAKTNLRSKTPRLVMQEMYALLIGYNLVRGLMMEAAEEHGLKPEEIGFVDTLVTVKHAMQSMMSGKTVDLPRMYRQLLADIAYCRNPRPRRKRQCPRVVRVKFGRFLLKRPWHKEEKLDFASCIDLKEINALA